MSYSYNNIVAKKAPKSIEALSSIILADEAPTDMTFEHVKEVDSTIIQNLLSAEECDALMSACDAIGWSFWGDADTGGSEAEAAADTSVEDEKKRAARSFRSADTIEVDLPSLTARIWNRLERCLLRPKVVITPEDEASYERDAEGEWHASGLNPNCLFARYLEGGHFAPHIDGTTSTTFNERSQYTLLVYLCDCDVGGETFFMTGDQREVLTKDESSGKMVGNGKNIVASVKPKKGSAVVFFHDVLHEGSPVGSGGQHKKVIIRGDVMYRRMPPQYDEPKDREAFERYQKARVMEADGDAMGAMKLFQSIRKLSPGIADVYQL